MRQFVRSSPVIDAFALALALAATAMGETLGLDVAVGWCALQVALTLVVLHVRRSGPSALRRAPIDDLTRLLAATTHAAILTIAIRAAAGSAAGAVADAARVWLFASVYLAVLHNESGAALRRARRRGASQVDTLIVGGGAVGSRLACRLRDSPELGLRPVGFLDADPSGAAAAAGIPVLGSPADAEAIIADHGVGHVIVAFSQARDEDIAAVVRTARRGGLDVSIVPRLFEEVTERVTVDHVGTMPLLRSEHPDPRSWRFAVKHAADRVIAATALVALLPLLVLIALAVALSSRGGVFFRQRRVGRDRCEFTLLKFRTMTGDPGSDGEADASWALQPSGVAPHGSTRHVTRVGRILRVCGLDELLQLLNVVRGHMSLVGPRPERVSYVERFEGEIRRYGDRHRVKSGITGWAQVNGLRGETSLAERIEHDNYYIENWGLLLDLRILLLTPPVVILAAISAVGRKAPREPEPGPVLVLEVAEPESREVSLAPR